MTLKIFNDHLQPMIVKIINDNWPLGTLLTREKESELVVMIEDMIHGEGVVSVANLAIDDIVSIFTACIEGDGNMRFRIDMNQELWHTIIIEPQSIIKHMSHKHLWALRLLGMYDKIVLKEIMSRKESEQT